MLCEKRIKNMEELCHKLPDNDQAYGMLESTKREVLEVSEQIKSTYLKLEEHPDKWKEWNERYRWMRSDSFGFHQHSLSTFLLLPGSASFLIGSRLREGS